MVFTLADLKRFPAVSRVHFLECSGNFGGRRRATELTPQQLAGLTSTSEWTGVALATLFREVGVQSAGHMVPRRGTGRGGAHAQHSRLQGERRCADRVRTERRSDPSGAGLSGAAVPAGLGRQRQRQMDAAHRAVGSSVHDPRGDLEVHRSDGRRHGAHLQLPDGCPLAHHLSGLSGDARPRLGRDQRHRVDRIRKDRARRRQHRWRRHMDGRETAGAGAVESAHAVPASVELDRRRGGDHEPRGRRDRLRAADAGRR